MNRNVMIVLAGGFLIAILVALLVQASLSGSKKEQKVAETREISMVKIIVASKDLKVGLELSEESMKWKDWPESAVFPGAVVREEGKKTTEMIEGKLIRPILEGEPITDSAILSGAQKNFIES